MTITAKYLSTCATCNGPIVKGALIEWQKGQAVRHATCGSTPRGASSPRRGSYGSTYTRFAGGAQHYTNNHGRCEDAPACGCCSC